MCGICGEIRLDGSAPAVTAIDQMTARMTSRGPDDMGLYMRAQMGFGHRRLSIIDLSTHAQQPMVDNGLGLGIVYNGEIYNYRELRDELIAKGYAFFSHGDTEVILKAYHAWGEDCVKRFYGMFAFVIWERDTGRVFCARDRLGIKPFYYTNSGQAFRFASSLPALLAPNDLPREIDPVALHYYMHFHSVVPPPHTMVKGIFKLPPASTLVIEPNGQRRESVYWQVDYAPDPQERSEEEWEALTLTALRRAVERRLVADVPVGVLLSGGVDSSLIVGLLAEAGQHGLQTFSIGFESVGEEQGDEFQYSDVIAQHFSTTHHKIRVDAERTLPAMQACVRAMAEPMVSHDVIGFYLLSEEVAKHVKVVQSGQGADEVFGGYHWYPPMLTSTDPVQDYAKVFFDRDHADYARLIQPEWVEEDYSRQFVEAYFKRPGAATAVDQALRIDTQVMLVDDPVKRVDNTSMAWGLEARVPFLDHDVVELAARMPATLKVGQGGKYILKEAARRVIPAAVIDRPKGYFPVPALKYLRGDYLNWVRDIMNEPVARQRGLFQTSYVEQLFAAPEEHITPLRGSKLWQVALLEFWLQTHGVG